MRLLFLSILLLTCGCASLGPRFAGLQPPIKDRALVYVYRPSVFTGSARSPDILLNDQKIGSISNGAYLVHAAKPGPSKVFMRNFAGEESGELEVLLKPDRIYFLRVDLSLPTLKESHDSKANPTGERCPFMGLNIMIPPSASEIAGALIAMDTRLQSKTCWPGFMFVTEDLATRELPKTKFGGNKDAPK